MTGPAVTPPAEPEHPDVVPWDDHVALRHENERYRKEYQPLEQALQGYEGEQRQAWIDFMSTARDDYDGALAALIESSPNPQALLQQLSQGFVETAPEYDPDEVVTRGELDQRDQELNERREIEAVESHAKSLGYTPGTPDWDFLLVTGAHMGGDLDKAHKAVAEMREAAEAQAVEKYLESRRAETETAAVVTPPGAGGAAPSVEEPPKSMQAAKASAVERIKRMRESGAI